jgi:hypothetical protein
MIIVDVEYIPGLLNVLWRLVFPPLMFYVYKTFPEIPYLYVSTGTVPRLKSILKTANTVISAIKKEYNCNCSALLYRQGLYHVNNNNNMFISKAHKCYSSYIDNINRKQHDIMHNRKT